MTTAVGRRAGPGGWQPFCPAPLRYRRCSCINERTPTRPYGSTEPHAHSSSGLGKPKTLGPHELGIKIQLGIRPPRTFKLQKSEIAGNADTIFLFSLRSRLFGKRGRRNELAQIGSEGILAGITRSDPGRGWLLGRCARPRRHRNDAARGQRDVSPDGGAFGKVPQCCRQQHRE
jgi:hypothetical protein